jgi:hypothetical protein
MIIARQCMFMIIVIGSYFILKWCKIMFSCFHYEFKLWLDVCVACLMELWSRHDLRLLMCQRNTFPPVKTLSFELNDKCGESCDGWKFEIEWKTGAVKVHWSSMNGSRGWKKFDVCSELISTDFVELKFLNLHHPLQWMKLIFYVMTWSFHFF